jgi:hypothetical protein
VFFLAFLPQFGTSPRQFLLLGLVFLAVASPPTSAGRCQPGSWPVAGTARCAGSAVTD